MLAELRADRDGAMQEWSQKAGWPVQTEAGWLFVSTELRRDQLAGDHDAWAGTPMTRETNFAWWVLPEVPAGSRYKFTDGAQDWVADPWARAITYDDLGEMSLVGPKEAHLERIFGVDDGQLSPRDLHVWVPEGEATHVLYAHDGQNLFDPGAFWGGWRLQDSAPPGMLIVGLDNTADRMDEYTHVRDRLDGSWYGGQGDAYAALVENTVRPLVREVYGEPAVVGTMGSSLGGLISFHLAYAYPGEYDFLASLSGTLGWGSIEAQEETMIQRYAAAGHQTTAIYLDSGGSGDTCADSDGDGTHDDDPNAADNYCENVQMQGVLEAAGYQYDVDLWHWHEPNAEHNEAEWAARVWRPLEIFAAR